MKKITILSGKGGVGKSSIAASLAVLLARRNRIIAADCDVDAPNLALVLGVKKFRKTEKIQTSEKAVIEHKKCSSCKKCFNSCYFNAIEWKNDKPIINNLLCEGCGVCQLVCPENAIKLIKVENAAIGYGKTKYGFEIISGQLKVGESGSGKVVSYVKTKAEKIGKKENAKIMITDAAAGIGCPVIASIAGSDYVVAITEPTPSALSDLNRALQMVNHFKIPAGIVINRYDINRGFSRKIEKFAKKENIKILEKIPYDRKFVDALVNLKPIVIYDKSKIKIFENIINNIFLRENKMTDKETKEHLKSSMQQYDDYDPIKDRADALRFGNIKNKNILDIGAGKGYLAILAAKNFNCNVTTIDYSREKINIAKENAGKEEVLDKIRFKLNNALDISFKKNSFDAVVSFNALHHNKGNYEKIIKEMFRVAKDKVVVTEINEFGAKIFDEHLFPTENHKDMAIDLKELENKLQHYSRVKRFDRKLMSTFVCEKNRDNMKNLINEFLDKKNVFAVIGVSRNPEKYGSKVYIDLKKAGYNVYPINPNADAIFGDKCYSELKNLPIKPDVVDLAVPPKITEKILRNCKKLGVDKVWMQPGSESGKAINFCKNNNIKVLHGICVMVERLSSSRGKANLEKRQKAF